MEICPLCGDELLIIWGNMWDTDKLHCKDCDEWFDTNVMTIIDEDTGGIYLQPCACVDCDSDTNLIDTTTTFCTNCKKVEGMKRCQYENNSNIAKKEMLNEIHTAI